MRSNFYPKIAFTNIKKNRKTYVPYILSCVGSLITFYILVALANDKGLEGMYGGSTMFMILNLGAIVIAVFAVIFLFYTNSFLIKRRKKEFGLYNILGMEKKHISKVMFFETIYVFLTTMILGLGLGFLLSKLLKLVLLKLVHLEVQFGFIFSIDAAILGFIIFGAIFFLSFLNTLRQIHLSNPIDLLKGGEKGEKEPKSNILITLAGIIALGGGYYIALNTKNPVEAVMMFFVAVLLVIVGTNLLFMSGSISFLKMLRQNKNYYYQPSHFISVSSMFYRMKQNAVGLANICILSTAVLVIVSSTVALYIGMEDIMRTRYERNVMVTSHSLTEEQKKQVDEIISEKSQLLNITPENTMKYSYKTKAVNKEGNRFYLNDTYDATDDFGTITMIPVSEYNLITGGNESLNPGEILLYCQKKDDFKNYKSGELKIADKTYSIKQNIEELKIEGLIDGLSEYMHNKYFIVMDSKNSVLEAANNLKSDEIEDYTLLSYIHAFDVKGASQQMALFTVLKDEFSKNELTEIYLECAEASKGDFYQLFGGLLFIGIFLGLVFVMAMVLIIYYKQISEGYEDKDRYEIMQKVGMSLKEVKKSIRSQVLTVFFLPLITAGIHIIFAFKIIALLLAALNLTNVTLYIMTTLCTFVIFALFYGLVYLMTAKVYYKIVKTA